MSKISSPGLKKEPRTPISAHPRNEEFAGLLPLSILTVSLCTREQYKQLFSSWSRKNDKPDRDETPISYFCEDPNTPYDISFVMATTSAGSTAPGTG